MTNADAKMRRLRALSDEVDAAASLFRHGFRILREYRFATRDADPLFVCFAGGAEKLLKLTLGMHSLEVDGDWPEASVMRSFGHEITLLNSRVQHLIQTRDSFSTAPGYLRQLLQQQATDLNITQILDTLERYAVRGRFFNLDYLADRPQPEASPAEMWEDLHQALLRSHPQILEKLASEEWEEGRREINETLEKSLSLWCEIISRAWTTGVFGLQAKQWSAQLDLGLG